MRTLTARRREALERIDAAPVPVFPVPGHVTLYRELFNIGWIRPVYAGRRFVITAAGRAALDSARGRDWRAARAIARSNARAKPTTGSLGGGVREFAEGLKP